MWSSQRAVFPYQGLVSPILAKIRVHEMRFARSDHPRLRVPRPVRLASTIRNSWSQLASYWSRTLTADKSLADAVPSPVRASLSSRAVAKRNLPNLMDNSHSEACTWVAFDMRHPILIAEHTPSGISPDQQIQITGGTGRIPGQDDYIVDIALPSLQL